MIEILVFLSHNKADKEMARKVATHLTLSNIDVWYDEWEVQAGDSIPGRLDEGLSEFDVFVILWSKKAERSNWVRNELSSAIIRAMNNESVRIIPCILDGTSLPPLISDLRYIDFNDVTSGIENLLGSITGIQTHRDRLLAIQSAIEGMDLVWITHPALPPMVCCPSCGETENFVSFQETDYKRDDVYYGLRCERCGWSDGGEL